MWGNIIWGRLPGCQPNPTRLGLRISQRSECVGPCGRLNNGPQKMSTMYSPERVTVIVHDKRNFADVIWLKIWRWEIVLDYSTGQYNHLGPYKGEAGGSEV